MSDEEKDPVRFGAEFGPYRSKRNSGVSLSTFKSLVWISNLGGLLLVVVALELMITQQRFYLGIAFLIAGIAIALFPSNYEIVGMEQPSSEMQGEQNSDDAPTAEEGN